MIVCAYFVAAFGTSTAIAVDSAADQFLLLGIANVAAILGTVAVVRYAA